MKKIGLKASSRQRRQPRVIRPVLREYGRVREAAMEGMGGEP